MVLLLFLLFLAAPLTAQDPVEFNAKNVFPASEKRFPSRLASLITNPGYGLCRSIVRSILKNHPFPGGHIMKKLKKPLFAGITIINCGKRVMTIAMTILAAGQFIPACATLAWNPGKPAPFRDANGRPLKGSISDKIKVNINGVEQGMFIMGSDSTRPVLLFVHGGPGMPEFAVSRQYPMVLEDHFTVCWWEHRGAGMSYSSDIPLSSMTFEQLIADILEVTRYLRKRFGR